MHKALGVRIVRSDEEFIVAGKLHDVLEHLFFGVGAYATAILTQKAGLPYLLSLVAGALFTTAIGALVALPALRLKNIYLAIATLGFGVVLQKIIFEWRSLTGGGGGLALTAPHIAGYELGATGLYYLTLAFLTVGLFGAWNVSRTARLTDPSGTPLP